MSSDGPRRCGAGLPAGGPVPAGRKGGWAAVQCQAVLETAQAVGLFCTLLPECAGCAPGTHSASPACAFPTKDLGSKEGTFISWVMLGMWPRGKEGQDGSFPTHTSLPVLLVRGSAERNRRWLESC